MMDDIPDGYCTPLRTSLTRPILLGGVPRAFAILNAMWLELDEYSEEK